MNQKYNIVAKIAESYSDKPIIQALLKLIPGSGSLDTLLIARAEEIRIERLRTFFDELANGKYELTEELIESKDFLHCYFKTVKAALNTRRHEKIKMFANLLVSGLDTNIFIDIDDYEENLMLLDELSYREIFILRLLDIIESNEPAKDGESELDRTARLWNKFTNAIGNRLNIKGEHIRDILNRLNRSGCYETFSGGYREYVGGFGKLTPTYYKLKRFIAFCIDDKNIYKENT